MIASHFLSERKLMTTACKNRLISKLYSPESLYVYHKCRQIAHVKILLIWQGAIQ